MPQMNLNNMKGQLTEDDIDKLVCLIGYRCRIKTLNRIRSVLTYPRGLQSYGIFDRVIKRPDGKWEYVAGQSYDDEIKTVRELIVK